MEINIHFINEEIDSLEMVASKSKVIVTREATLQEITNEGVEEPHKLAEIFYDNEKETWQSFFYITNSFGEYDTLEKAIGEVVLTIREHYQK